MPAVQVGEPEEAPVQLKVQAGTPREPGPEPTPHDNMS
jgi:hypothetical protein